MTKNQANKQLAVKKAKQKQIQRAINGANKEFGPNTVMELGSDKAIMNIDSIPTGSFALDNAIGIGGYPRGRVTDITGPESSGKTTLALEATAQVQKNGGTVFYLDSENAIHPKYAKKLGVNLNDLLICQPNDAEQGLQVTEGMIKTNAIDLVVIDSVADLVPRTEIQDNMADQHVGLLARDMSKFLRDIAKPLNQTNTCCLLINQTRDQIGGFMAGKTQPGGNALKFSSSVMLTLSAGKKLKQGTTVVGRKPFVNIKKNKVAPPFGNCHLDLMNGANGTYGLDTTGELVDMASKKHIVDKAGAWYSYGNQRIGQGRENAKSYINHHPNMKTELTARVCKAYGIKVPKDVQKAVKALNAPQVNSTTSKKSTTKSNNKKSSKSKNK